MNHSDSVFGKYVPIYSSKGDKLLALRLLIHRNVLEINCPYPKLAISWCPCWLNGFSSHRHCWEPRRNPKERWINLTSRGNTRKKLESRKHSRFTGATNYHSLVEFVANRIRRSRCHAILLAGCNRVFSVAWALATPFFMSPRDRWGVARQPTKISWSGTN